MDLIEVGWGHGLNRCGSGQGEVAVSFECGEFLSSFSGRTLLHGISALHKMFGAKIRLFIYLLKNKFVACTAGCNNTI
jgi:hypothetical protein